MTARGPSAIGQRPSATASPLLAVEHLTVELPVDGTLLPAVDDVSFSLRTGEAVAIVGESGCGKTQLARAILGLSPEGARVDGRVSYGGRDLLGLSDRDWGAVRGRRIGFVFQEPASALDPVQTVGAQIREAILCHEDLSRAETRRRAREVLRDVAFPDPDRGLDEYPHRLSGGLRQRAHIASALVSGPDLLIADEPTASLDSTVAASVLELLDRLRVERGLTLLLITHDLAAVARHCDRVLVLYAGRIVEEADTGALFRTPAHPYTRGLLRSVPRIASAIRQHGRRYEAIPGGVADLSARPSGACAFAPRCPDRFAPCDAEMPELFEVDTGRARCFLYRPGSPARAS